ncbi:hypothetical protein [Endozoicomonas sp. YOMI1]|uniref:hypothetical protein n=1 Tax=Endozoicomonas sp. YOMI1 TaxID=2828739 RepID=UPI0021494C31|nr:hypothetical protein [Endozoicomonas sp. YOMI1]
MTVSKDKRRLSISTDYKLQGSYRFSVVTAVDLFQYYMKPAFINGNDGSKQVRNKREDTFEAFAEREALLRSADFICLNQNELWEYIQTDDDCLDIEPSESDLAILEWDGDDEKASF